MHRRLLLLTIGFVYFPGAASADVLYGKDGKPVPGKFSKETPQAIEWVGSDGKKKEFPKTKIARVDFTWDEKAPESSPAVGDSKELKNLLFSDETLGVAFEPPKEFLVSSESYKRKLVLKWEKKGSLQFVEHFTVEKLESVAKKVTNDDGLKLSGVEWKEEGEVAAPFPGKRFTASWKVNKDAMKREYQFLQLPGRILAITVEAPAANFAVVKKSTDAAIATLKEFEPSSEQKYDKAGFSLIEAPKAAFKYKGSSSHKMEQGGLEGDKYEWISESYVMVVQVFEKDIPRDNRAVKDLMSNEYTKYSNITVNSEGVFSLINIEAPWLDATAELKGSDKGKENILACMFLSGGKLYSVNLYHRNARPEDAKRLFENCVGVVRTAGMRESKESRETK